jgi:hypothetical protein
MAAANQAARRAHADMRDRIQLRFPGPVVARRRAHEGGGSGAESADAAVELGGGLPGGVDALYRLVPPVRRRASSTSLLAYLKQVREE